MIFRQCLAVLLVLATLTTAHAEDIPENVDVRGRVMNGHRFIPSEMVNDPFVVTRFGSRTGFGLVDVGEVDDKAISELTLSQGFSLSTQFFDIFSLEFDGGGTFFSGGDYYSIMAQGMNAGYDTQGQVKVSPFGNDWFRVAVSASIGYRYDYLVFVGEGVDNVKDQLAENMGIIVDEIRDDPTLLNNPDYSTDSLTDRMTGSFSNKALSTELFLQQTSLIAGGGLQIASAFHPSVGLVASFDVHHGSVSLEKEGASSDHSYLLLTEGILLSFDAAPLADIPVGLTLSYQRQDPQGDDLSLLKLSSRNAIGGAIFYTGRPEVAIGADINAISQDDRNAYSGPLQTLVLLALSSKSLGLAPQRGYPGRLT